MSDLKKTTVVEDPELRSTIEGLAVKTHETWMQERQSQGWAYGERRDDGLKLHPCMVPYDQLPESEKELDRQTARTVLVSLEELGYSLTKNKRRATTVDMSYFADLKSCLDAESPPTLATLHSLWCQYRSLATCPAELYLKLGEAILRRGEPILAYDALSLGLSRADEHEISDAGNKSVHVRLRQLLSLALAQSGAAERAHARLDQLCREGHDTPETLGLLGRVYKDLAFQSVRMEERKALLFKALDVYRLGFEKGAAAYRDGARQPDGEDAYYCGINAAAVSVLQGEFGAARAVVDRVKDVCDSLLAKPEPSYWLLATMGEAELISGHFEEAKRWYGKSVTRAGNNWRELASTRRQARQLSVALGIPMAELDDIFPRFAATAFASPAWTHSKLPESTAWEDSLYQTTMIRLQKVRAVFGYFSALSPADIIFGECLIASGAEAHVVLPYRRTQCRAMFANQAQWQHRWDKLLANASSIVDDTQQSCLQEHANFRFAMERMVGSACLRANQLDGELFLWCCDQGPQMTSKGFKQKWESILPVSIQPGSTPTKGSETTLVSSKPSAPESAEGSHEVKAMLFADIRGYSKLDDVTLFRLSRIFTGHVAGVLDRHDQFIASRRTAGDGLFLVFDDVSAAAEVAFDLRDMMRSTNWSQFHLPPQLGLRISLDAGPVYLFHNAVLRAPDVCGAYVNRAARIEPITPPNEVYASETFSSLYLATGSDRFHFEYVGQTQLPKQFGLTPLYCLSRRMGFF